MGGVKTNNWAVDFLNDIATDPDEERTITSRQAAALLGALVAARVQPAPDENALPMEMLPEGWRFNLLKPFDGLESENAFACELVTTNVNGFKDVHAFGPTPRAAFLAAIEAAPHE